MKKSKFVHITDDIEAVARGVLMELDNQRSDGSITDRLKVVCLALLTERHAERERSGGASATRFRNLLVITHPDMPTHIWDGVEMRPVKFSDQFISTAIDTRNETL